MYNNLNSTYMNKNIYRIYQVASCNKCHNANSCQSKKKQRWTRKICLLTDKYNTYLKIIMFAFNVIVK